jgi:arsenate reductase
MKNVLVLCTGNSCRSQMAHGYLAHFTDSVKVKVYSAGVETHGVNALAVAIMQEDGVDISKHTSNNVDEYIDIPFDYVITVCDHAKERCQFFPTQAVKLHHNFPDPSKVKGTTTEVIEEFRRVREMIKEYCEALVTEYKL